MNRAWALVSVAALFLAGISIGALGMHLLQERSHDGFRHPFFRQHHRVWGRYLSNRLDLTADQRKKIAEIRRKSWRDSEALRREMRPKIEKQMEATREKILAVLTPEQRQELDKILREEPRALHRFFLGEGGRRPPAPPGPPEAPRPGPPPGPPPPREPPPD